MRRNNDMQSDSNTILFARKEALSNYDAHGLKKFLDRNSGYIDGFKQNGIGFVSVYGGMGNAYYDSWFTTYADIRASVEQMRKDDEVKGVLLAIDSPGGMALGLFETCRMIKELASEKPVYAYIDGMACSAAYAIATACTKVYIGPGGETGCCGCYSEALEWSEDAYKEVGLLHRIFRSRNAPKKNQSVITNEEAAKEYQKSIDDHGDAYLALCAENRGVEKENAEKTFGQGAVVSAQYALDNDMVDVIETMDTCLSDLVDVCGIGKEEEGEVDTPKPDSSLTAESKGGSSVTLEDFNKLSEEEQRSFTSELLGAHPSLFAERDANTRKAERDRISSLNALRDGSAEVDKLVDEAVESDRTANDIAPDVVKTMKAGASKASKVDSNEAAMKMLGFMADNDNPANVPSAKSDEEIANSLINDINTKEKVEK